MFNAPRPSQPYGATTTSNGFGVASFVDENPLANSVASVYDGLDPWSAAPSPSPPPITTSAPSALSAVIGEATIPPIYHKAFSALDTTSTGDVSVNSLSRVLGTSSLPASTIDRIVNLVSSRPRVSRLEFFVALALAALAQSGRDVSVEQVAALAQQDALPEPSLDLASLQASTSDFYTGRKTTAAAAMRSYSDDPWGARFSVPPTVPSEFGAPESPVVTTNGAPSALAGTGLPKDWWKKQETVSVRISGQQGFILNRYTVYEITSERGAPVSRRYSEFVFLWDCLVRRYPFRLLLNLPPKRLGPDENFIEQRRRGLARFLNFVINHPVIKEDGLLAGFLAEPSLETWRKQSSISLEEEAASKRVDKVEEMAIPSDLDDKLATVRGKIGQLIEQWQKICILTERIMRRRESAASDLSRLTNTMKVLVEVNERCWRGDECELCSGVKQGVSTVAMHTSRHADLLEQRTRTMLYVTLEALKGQRDLYIAMRDLFIRHDRLSGDQVERLKKRVDTNSAKLDSIRSSAKEGWQEEVDKYAGLIEKDKASIAASLNRRVFIRACMWHELRVVLHNRENTLLTQTVRNFAREEQDFSESVLSNWSSLVEAVEPMPYE